LNFSFKEKYFCIEKNRMSAVHGAVTFLQLFPMGLPSYSFFLFRLPFFPFTYNYFFKGQQQILESQNWSMYNKANKGQHWSGFAILPI